MNRFEFQISNLKSQGAYGRLRARVLMGLVVILGSALFVTEVFARVGGGGSYGGGGSGGAGGGGGGGGPPFLLGKVFLLGASGKSRVGISVDIISVWVVF